MDFGPLALVVAAGLVGPLLASCHRVGTPVVVGQIVAGVVIGNGGLGWVAVMVSMLVTLGACAVGGSMLGHGCPLTDTSAPVDRV